MLLAGPLKRLLPYGVRAMEIKIPTYLKASPEYLAKQLAAWSVILSFIASIATATGYNVVFSKDFKAHVALMNSVTCVDVEFFYYRAKEGEKAHFRDGTQMSAPEIKELSELDRQMDLFHCQRVQ